MSSSTAATPFQDFHFKSIGVGKIFLSLGAASIIVFFLFILKLEFKRRAYQKRMPGRKVRFFDILGNSRDLLTNESTGAKNGLPFDAMVLQTIQSYAALFSQDKLFCFWISYFPFIIIHKAEAVEASISGTKMMEKGWSYNFLHPWLGTGLLTSHGSKWKSRRKLLTPCFHFDILKDFLPVFNEQAQVLVKVLSKEIKKDFTDIVQPVTLCSLDIICETTLGVKVGAQENSESEYVKAVSRVSELMMERIMKFTKWLDFIYYFTKSGKELQHYLKLLHNFTRSVIHEKKAKLLSGDESDTFKRRRKALMDLLLVQHIQMKNLTEEDIREEVDTFAFEGHDTTSMGMSWALYLIGLYKNVQDKIHEELDSIFGDDTESPITTDDLNDMKYLDCVLKESQRLYPSVPFIARQVTDEFNICGHYVPKGATFVVFTYQLHRDEAVFPNPEKFDPDRFLPENCTNRHPYAYIPFSAGPRNCIGQRFALMEEKVVVATVLRNYRIESLDHRDRVLPAAELILRASKPIRIKIRPRHLNKS